MSIITSIVITVFLYIITSLLDLLILSFDKNPATYRHIIGLSGIIPSLIAYPLLIAHLRFSKVKISFNKGSLITNYRILIPILWAFVVGDHLFNLPFFHWKNLSNKYFGTTLEIPDYSNYKFSVFQFYFWFRALIIAPIFEEIFFRYYIFEGLLKKYSFLTSLFTSSILFSLIHIDSLDSLHILVPAFVFGIISSLVYFKTQKIFYSIILHFFANGIWLLRSVYTKEYSALIKEIGFGLIFWVIFLIGIILLLIGIKRITSSVRPVFRQTPGL